MTISHTIPVGEGKVREKEEKGKCRGEHKVWGPIGARGKVCERGKEEEENGKGKGSKEMGKEKGDIEG